MKRIYQFMLLGLIAVLAACTEKEADFTQITGQSITVAIPQNVPTDNPTDPTDPATTPGNGSLANRCIMGIYLDGKEYDKLYTKVEAGKATFADLRLVTGKEYVFVFWADHVTDASTDEGLKNNGRYNADDLANISMQGEYVGNSEEFDAFFATETFTATEKFALDVTLKRPFGQLNVTTTDWDKIPDGFGLKPDQVTVTFATPLPNSFNAITGGLGNDVKDNLTYTVSIADVTTANCPLTVDYIWAPVVGSGDEKLYNFKMDFLNSGNVVVSNDNFKNIPVKRNFRTNVTGNLLTKGGDITVTIDPIFEQGDVEITDEHMQVETAEEAQKALEQGITNIEIASVTEDMALTIPKAFAADETVSIKLPETTNKVTIAAATTGNGEAPAEVNISSPSVKELVVDMDGKLNLQSGTTVESLTVTNGEVTGEEGSVVKVFNINNGANMGNAMKLSSNGICETSLFQSDVEFDVVNLGYSETLAGNLNLNEHTITYHSYQTSGGTSCPSLTVEDGTNCTIQNGTFVSDGMNAVEAAATLHVGNGATLTLDGVTLESNSSAIVPAYPGTANVIVKNSTIDALYYAVSTNASHGDKSTPNIILENSTFIAESPVFINVPAQLEMKNCTTKGKWQGLVVRGGTAVIDNCDITFEYDEEYDGADYQAAVDKYINSNWGGGNNIPRGALIIGNRHTTSYLYPTNVELINARLHLEGTYGSHFRAIYGYANTVGDVDYKVELTYDAQCVFGGKQEFGGKEMYVNGVKQEQP